MLHRLAEPDLIPWHDGRHRCDDAERACGVGPAGKGYGLAAASGIPIPTRAEFATLARLQTPEERGPMTTAPIRCVSPTSPWLTTSRTRSRVQSWPEVSRLACSFPRRATWALRYPFVAGALVVRSGLCLTGGFEPRCLFFAGLRSAVQPAVLPTEPASRGSFLLGLGYMHPETPTNTVFTADLGDLRTGSIPVRGAAQLPKEIALVRDGRSPPCGVPGLESASVDGGSVDPCGHSANDLSRSLNGGGSTCSAASASTSRLTVAAAAFL